MFPVEMTLGPAMFSRIRVKRLRNACGFVVGQVVTNIRSLFTRLDRYLKDLKDDLDELAGDPRSGVCVCRLPAVPVPVLILACVCDRSPAELQRRKEMYKKLANVKVSVRA